MTLSNAPFFAHPWLRRALWTVLSLVLLSVLAWLGVPPLVKHLAQQQGEKALGRKVTVGAVSFKPWSMELTVTDVAVATADGQAKQLSLAKVYANAQWESVWRMGPVFDAVTVQDPVVQITHLGDGRYDIDDVLAKLNTPNDSAPVRFALHNVRLSGGAIDFYDTLPAKAQQAPVVQHHTVRHVELWLPFLSNLDAQRDITVTPHLAFELNGAAFDSAAQGTPFAQVRKGELALKFTHVDLAPYLPYLPASLPVRVQSAVVAADMQLHFAQDPATSLRLEGKLTVSDLQVADPAGGALLALDSVQADVADVRPLERRVALTSLAITGPKLRVQRAHGGRLNWDLASTAPVATKKVADGAYSAGAAGQKPSEEVPQKAADAPQDAWKFSLARLHVEGGELQWVDQALPSPVRVDVKDIAGEVQGIAWPFVADKAATFEGSLAVPMAGKNATLKFKGSGSDVAAQVHAELAQLPLAIAQPYVSQYLAPRLMGQADAQWDVDWRPGQLAFKVQKLSLSNVALRGDLPAGQNPKRGALAAWGEGNAWPQWRLLEVKDARVDVTRQTVQVGQVRLQGPRALLQRDAQGQWMAQRWLKETAAQTAQATPAVPGKPWTVALADMALDDGFVVLDDRSMPKPVRVELSGMQLQAKGFTLDGAKPVALSVATRVKAGRTEAGSLRYSGTASWAPLLVQGSVEAIDVPAHALAPYVGERLNIDLLRADSSFKGDVRFASAPAGVSLTVRGDGALEDFRAHSASAAGQAESVGDELLSWKSLNVPGIRIDMAPGAATQVDVREAVLSDFYARLVVDPKGRLNLQGLVKPAPAGTEAAGQDAHVRMGPVRLVNGKVYFSDRFIQPNYSADLSELTGSLSGFSSRPVNGQVQLADLDVRGRAEGTASLAITGKVNPLAKPLALDIKGRVRDLELPPLSPYAIKYAGYGIERGKLSVDVSYTVQPDGQLTANNNIVLNQLVFGDKVDGAPNSLPVKLAVALLADRHGVIDIDLPISGSLNDPQFKLGAVVWKVITNLVVKAVTSPFTLLSKAFGGGAGDELSAVPFAPGSAELGAQAKEGLDKVAKALVDRPSLAINVVGLANLEAEREAIKSQRLVDMLKAEKRRRAAVAGQDVAQVEAVSEAESAALLKEVYRRADIVKPRNLVGLSKDLPDADMRALLLGSLSVNAEAVRALALQRGVAVKDYLGLKQLPAARLFLGAPKVVPAADGWSPHAELSISNP
ncbi:DUF748 domain-containing protein [Rhodoferax aquaticus]|nr:DUF748 domain-containing protein [Rhodoferax aquaticus]